jgi:tetratricopeptide (TPR) repeat protein
MGFSLTTRFYRLLIIAGLLAFALPFHAQEPSPDSSTSTVRVPPPPENGEPAELETQGDQLRGQKLYLDSIDYYRAAIKKTDTSVLHNKVGMCLLQLRRDSEAGKEFRRAIKLNKDYAEAYNNLGALYYNARKYNAAIHEYKKAIKLNEESASFHSNLGGAYFSQKDYDRAAKEYQRAVELDPDIFQRQSSSAAISIRLVGSNDLGHFHYVMAQMYGQHGDQQHCRFYLSKANEEGYPIKGALRDNEFATLRKDPQFVEFVRSLKPPSSSPSN